MRYIIGFLSVMPTIFIQEAQDRFAMNAEGYLLSKNSLPHITLAQFYTNDTNKLVEIWNEIKGQVVNTYQPKFTGIGFTKKAKNLWGVSLSVEREPTLVNQHVMVIKILKKYNLACINQIREFYRPHLTLARIKELKISEFNDSILEPTPFVLSLGQSDDNGQYLNIIFSIEDPQTLY